MVILVSIAAPVPTSWPAAAVHSYVLDKKQAVDRAYSLHDWLDTKPTAQLDTRFSFTAAARGNYDEVAQTCKSVIAPTG